MNNKLNYISNLRIICTLLVILGHSYPFGIYIPDFLYDIRTIIYTFHMPLFILISGYLTIFNKSVERHGSISYLKSRTVKLLTPYLVLSTLFFVPKSFLDSNMQLSVKSFLENIFVPRLNVWGHFWFLPMLVIFTILSVFFYKLIKNKKYIAVIFLVISYLLIYMPVQSDLLSLNDIKNNLFWYLSGMLLGSIKIKSIENTNKKIFLTIFCLIILIFTFFNLSSGVLNIFIKTLITMLMCYGLFIGLFNYKLNNIKFFNVIDKYSFSLFILSWPFQSIAEIISNKFLNLHFLISMLIMFVSGIVFPLLTIKMFNLIYERISNHKIKKLFDFAGISIGLK